MRDNRDDKTLIKNYIKKWKYLVSDYELVKAKKHPHFRFVQDFYNFHDIKKQTFFKYYHRFKKTGLDQAFFPRKRGPKFHSRTPLNFIENKVTELRRKGMNRYEIHSVLKPKLKHHTPSPSGNYNIFKRHGLNKMTKQIKRSKQKIIKKRAGELAHVDCHYLAKETFTSDSKRRY